MNYYYKAKNIKGHQIKGKNQFDNMEELINWLNEKGYTLSYCQEDKLVKLNDIFTRVSYKEMYILFKQLNVLLKSGISINKSLEIVCTQINNKKLQKSLIQINKSIHQGYSLSNSMTRYKDIYPEFAVKMISIGEYSGNLDDIFFKLYNYYYRIYNYSQTVREAVRYPAFLSVFSLVVLYYLLTSVIPQFADIIVDLGGSVPVFTTIVLKVSAIFSNTKVVIAFIFFFGAIILFYFKYKSLVKKTVVKYFSHIPILNKVINDILQYKFLSMFYMLLSSGIPIFQSLFLVKENIKDKSIIKIIENITVYIQQGVYFSNSIKYLSFFDPIIVSLISIGEESGNMEEMLEQSVNIIEERVNKSINTAIKLIEPALILTIGATIMIIILSVIVPMLSIIDSVGV